MIYDMHCHVGFGAQDPQGILSCPDQDEVACLCATVEPGEYRQLASDWEGHPWVRFALGIHPQWMTKGICDQEAMELFEQLAPSARIISEVGLDYRQKWVSSQATQVEFFHRVLECCACGDKVLSIHSSEAEAQVLDLMEEHGTFRNNRCIFHWFSGPCDQLHRAIKLGAYFSAGAKMTRSKKGREYLKVIPADRLLLETDYPREEGAFLPWREQVAMLREIQSAVENIRGQHLADRVAGTSRDLLDMS